MDDSMKGMEGSRPFPGMDVVEMGGPVGLCHRDAARLWRDLRGWAFPTVQLCTGLALSGGVWSRHSWCVYHALGEPVILEPSTARESYFGKVLVDGDADCFLLEHK